MLNRERSYIKLAKRKRHLLGALRRGLTLTILMFILSVAMSDLAWASPTKVYIDPTFILDPNLVPGTRFTINITVDYVEELYAYQFELSFNPAVLHGVSVENGPFLGSAGGNVLVAPGPGFDNERGKLGLFSASLFPKENFPTGGGVLAYVTFEVVGIGGSPIDFGWNTALLNQTGGFELGPDWEPMWIILNPDAFVGSYFDNRGVFSADLVRRSAWPEHHHYVVSKDEDEYQTLYGKVRNLGTVEIYVKVVFDVSKDGAPPERYETDVEVLAPGEIRNLTFNLTITNVDVGKYSVIARCHYSPDGDHWGLLGDKIKRFSFSVVP
jgi:hypothetical protein